jgi:hypothetical protein
MIEIFQWTAVIVTPILGVYFMWKEIGWIDDLKGSVLPTIIMLGFLLGLVALQVLYLDVPVRFSLLFPDNPVSVQIPLLIAVALIIYDLMCVVNKLVFTPRSKQSREREN